MANHLSFRFQIHLITLFVSHPTVSLDNKKENTPKPTLAERNFIRGAHLECTTLRFLAYTLRPVISPMLLEVLSPHDNTKFGSRQHLDYLFQRRFFGMIGG